MVQLPGVEDVGRPRAPRPVREEVDLSGPQSFGNALMGLGRDLKAKQQHATDGAFLASLDASARRRATTMTQEVNTGPEDPNRTRTELFTERWSGSIDTLISEAVKATGLAPSEAALAEARNQLTVRGGSLGARVLEAEASTRLNTINDTLSSTIDSLALSAFNDPETLDELRDTAAQAIMDVSGDVPADVVAEHNRRAQRNLTVGAVRGLIDASPAVAIAGLESGEFDGGLTAQNKAVLLDAARTAQARNEREAQSAAEIQHDIRLSDLEIAVSRGQATTIDIEAAFDDGNGFITPAERTRLTKAADDFTSDAIERAAQISRVNTSGVSTPFLDPRSSDDRKAVDVHFSDWLAGLSAPQPEVAALPSGIADSVFATPRRPADIIQAATADYVARYGIVPPQLRSSIRGALRTGATQDRLEAAATLALMQERAPFTRMEFDTEDFLLAQTINDAVESGAEPSDAVDRANRLLVGADTPERQARDRNWRDNKMEETALDFLAERADPWFAFNIAVPDALSGSFVAKTRRIYNLSGDIGASITTAWNEILRVWALTEIGTRRLQQFAPEAVYANGHDSEWMEEQFRAEFASRSLLPADTGIFGSGTTFDFDRLILEPDHRTLRSNQPSYLVMMQDENGVFNPVMEGDQPLRWRPDWATSPAGIRFMEEQAESVDAARRVRQGDIQNIPEAFEVSP